MSDNMNHLGKYISMSEFAMNWCFSDELIQGQYVNIKPLSQEYSSFLWEKYVSKSNRHLMLLAKDEWPSSLELGSYNWEADWNNNIYNYFGAYLDEQVSFMPNDIIYFFWMKELCVETVWWFFLKYWILFLFEDEGTLIINPSSLEAISFGPSGSVFIGNRKHYLG